MFLELGSGDRPTPGYVHNDARPLPHVAPHMVFDASAASSHVGVEVCDAIRATHLLEHFSHLRTVAVLTDWLACLKPGGKLYVEVPNFEAQARLLLGIGQPANQAEAVRLAYGGQEYEGNAHYTGFTPATLQAAAEAAGFVQVRVQDIGFVLILRAEKPPNLLADFHFPASEIPVDFKVRGTMQAQESRPFAHGKGGG